MSQELSIRHDATFDKFAYAKLLLSARFFLFLCGIISCAIGYRLAAYGKFFLVPAIMVVGSVAAGRYFPKLFAFPRSGKRFQKTLSHLNRTSMVLIAGDALFEAIGSHPGPEGFLTSFALTFVVTIAGGAILGRFWGIFPQILHVLKENPAHHLETK